MFDAAGTLVQVYDATRNIRTDYVSGPNGGLARIKRIAGVDEVSFIHADHLGTGRVGTAWGGAQEWEDWHTPFGESLIHPDETDDQGDFTGHIRDKATGLTYMQARYYDPVIGRFLAEDPVTMMDMDMHPGYFNRYAYTLNDPINLTDPTGMCSEDGKSGLCGDNQSFIDTQIADPNSIAGQTDAILQASGIRADITEDQTIGASGGCPAGGPCGANVPVHNLEIVVENADGSISSISPPQDEVFEHEVGHIFEALTSPASTDTVTTSSGTSFNDQITKDGKGVSPGHATTINRVNGYRRSKSRGYERVCSRCSEKQARDAKTP